MENGEENASEYRGDGLSDRVGKDCAIIMLKEAADWWMWMERGACRALGDRGQREQGSITKGLRHSFHAGRHVVSTASMEMASKRSV